MGDQERAAARGEYTRLRMELQDLYGKVAALESDRSEHEIVLAQLKTVPSDRRCWQQIGEALCEQNVESVQGSLTANLEKIGSTVEKLSAQLQERETRLGELAAKYGFSEKDIAPPGAAGAT